MIWRLHYSRAARKDALNIQRSHLREKVDDLLDLLERDPFETPPPYEQLVGDLKGFSSRRINIHHRLVYRVDREHRRVFVERMWTHYE